MKRRAFISALAFVAAGAAAQLTFVNGRGVLGFRQNGVGALTGTSTSSGGSSFNPTTCAVATISGAIDSGGNLFDCYADGKYNLSMPAAGSGLDNFIGDNPFLTNQGDTFESYADGSYSGGTPGTDFEVLSSLGLNTIYTT